jgi:hypothetical protein
MPAYSFESVRRRAIQLAFMGALVIAAQQHSARAAATEIEPRLSFQANTVVVSNVTIGGKVVLLAETLSNYHGSLRAQSERLVLTDDDRDGVVRYDLPYALPHRSIWLAVDFESGRYAVAGAPGYDVDLEPFPLASLKANAAGESESIEEERRELRVVVIRPGDGAWSIVKSQSPSGTPDDVQHGKLKIRFDSLQPFVGTKALKQLKNGDTVVGFDARIMQVFATTVTK